jgi:hypothetical protein
VGNDGDRVEGVEGREVGEVTRHPLPLKKTAGRPEAHRAVLPLARQEHGRARTPQPAWHEVCWTSSFELRQEYAPSPTASSLRIEKFGVEKRFPSRRYLGGRKSRVCGCCNRSGYT